MRRVRDAYTIDDQLESDTRMAGGLSGSDSQACVVVLKECEAFLLYVCGGGGESVPVDRIPSWIPSLVTSFVLVCALVPLSELRGPMLDPTASAWGANSGLAASGAAFSTIAAAGRAGSRYEHLTAAGSCESAHSLAHPLSNASNSTRTSAMTLPEVSEAPTCSHSARLSLRRSNALPITFVSVRRQVANRLSTRATAWRSTMTWSTTSARLLENACSAHRRTPRHFFVRASNKGSIEAGLALTRNSLSSYSTMVGAGFTRLGLNEATLWFIEKRAGKCDFVGPCQQNNFFIWIF